MSEINRYGGSLPPPSSQDIDTSPTGSNTGNVSGRGVGKDVGVKLEAPELQTPDKTLDLDQRKVDKPEVPVNQALRSAARQSPITIEKLLQDPLLGWASPEISGWTSPESQTPSRQDVDTHPHVMSPEPESVAVKSGELKGILANWSNDSPQPPPPQDLAMGTLTKVFQQQQQSFTFGNMAFSDGVGLGNDPPPLDQNMPVVVSQTALDESGMELEEFQPYHEEGLSGSEAKLLKEAGLGPKEGTMYREVNLKVTPDTLISEFNSSNETGSKELGSGAFNTVYEVSYEGDKVGVFKALPEIDGINHVEEGWAADRIGINSRDPQTAMRNLGTVALAKKLGFAVVTNTRIGEHDGKLGLVMDKAPGKPAYLANKDLFKNPEARRELTRLQLLDALVGQGDRHANNYFIHQDSSTGKVTVTGIDNDQCFGKDLTDPNGIARGEAEHNWGFRGVKLPPVVDRATAEALLKLTPEDLDDLLGDKLLPEEIAATKERLTGIQEHLKQLDKNDRLIANSEEWGNDEVSELLDTSNSYAGRDGYGSLQLPDQDIVQELNQTVTPTF